MNAIKQAVERIRTVQSAMADAVCGCCPERGTSVDDVINTNIIIIISSSGSSVVTGCLVPERLDDKLVTTRREHAEL